jgi:tetratricopeptide (TPR) repeat protein
VQYAHEHGVVHRDLKPSNIMVDEHGLPRVVDFGIARAAEDAGAVRTDPGVLVGTIAYMSPEQAAGGEADALSDVYALGVVMYQALAGHLPVEPGSSSVLGTLRLIREGAAPRLGAVDRALRGDLEAIVACAMERDRTRRYASAAALAADLRRYLDGSAVAARRAGLVYQVRKLARRHRVAAMLSAAVVLALALGLAGTAQGLRRAERRRATAEAVSDLLESTLRAANPHEVRGAAYTVRQLLDDFTRGLHERLAGQPAVEARVRSTVGNAYRLLGEYGAARENLEAALALRRATLSGRDPLIGASLRDLGWLDHDLAGYAGAERLFREALGVQRRALNAGDPEIASTLLGISDVLRHQERFEEAGPLALEVLERRRRALGPEHPDTAEAMANLSKLARDRGDLPDAVKYLDGAVGIWERAYRGEHPRLVDGLNDRAWVQFQRGDFDAALATLNDALAMGRRILGQRHPDVANTLYEKGVIEDAAGSLGEAESDLRAALEMYRRAHGDRHPSVFTTLDALAQHIIRVRGDYRAAEPLVREALEGRRAVLGPASGQTALSLNSMARIMKNSGRPEEALALFREAAGALRSAYGPDHPFLAITEHDLGELLWERGERGEGEAAVRDALRINAAALGAAHASTIIVATTLAEFLNASQRCGEAEALLAPLLPAASSGSRTWRTGATLAAYGAALLEAGRASEAEPVLRQAVEVLEAKAGPGSPRAKAARHELARARGEPEP